MPGIGIVTNPNSRRNRRNPEQFRRLGYILGSEHDRHELTKHPDDIREVAQRFLEKGVEVLALNGGDGTNHVTLTTFIEVYGDTPLPKIAFLRGGTMNTISNSVGVRGTPGKILLNISEKYHLGHPFEITERDIIRVEFGEHCYYGFIFGNGIIYNFLDAYYATSNPGPPMAAKLLARAVGSAMVGGSFAKRLGRPFRARVRADGRSWEAEEFTAVMAASIEQIGLGFRPFNRCREQPGKFNVIGITCSALGVASELPRIRLGQLIAAQKARSEIASEVVFEPDETLHFTIDGDLHHSDGPVKLSTGPRMQIIVR